MNNRNIRLHHLDFLRAAMMFLGVVVHASHADFDLGDYEGIRFASGTFRMACFFIISGFFSVLVLEKSSWRDFLWKRTVMLGVPAVLCVLLLVPITVDLMQTYFLEGRATTKPHSGWMGHAWFLFVLLAYTLLLAPLKRLIEVTVPLFARVMPLALSQCLVLLGAIGFSMLAAKVVLKFGPQIAFYKTWGFLLTSVFNYLPYFLLGMMMFKWQNIYRRLHAHPFTWSAYAALFIAAKYHLSQHEITTTYQHLLYMTVSHCTAIFTSAALFSVGLRFLGQSNPLVRAMSESAYTVYIFHYIIIAWVLVELQRLGIAMPVRAAAALFAAIILGMAFHARVVKRFSLVALLCNGRLQLAKRA